MTTGYHYKGQSRQEARGRKNPRRKGKRFTSPARHWLSGHRRNPGQRKGKH